jgi:hypothetical protein
VVLGLLAYLVIKTELGVMLKLVLVVMVSGFYWLQYHSLLQYAGWPSRATLPEDFILIASEVREPDSSTGDPGVMYWWVRESGDNSEPPRVYELPYRSELHEQGEQVVQEQKNGAQFIGRRESSAASAQGIGVSFERISKVKRHSKD